MADIQNDHSVPDLPGIIIDDVIEAQTRLISDNSEFNRRAFVRTVFAAIEGVVHIIRRDLLSLAERHPMTFSRAEIALLNEEAYFVDARGRPKCRPQFMPLTDTIRFVVSLSQRHLGMKSAVDFNHAAWARLQTSLRVRHRLTHPKTEEDLEVSAQDAVDAMSGFLWVLALAVRLTGKAREASQFDAQKMLELQALGLGG